MSIIAFITDANAIRRILVHLGIYEPFPPPAAPASPPRAPPPSPLTGSLPWDDVPSDPDFEY